MSDHKYDLPPRWDGRPISWEPWAAGLGGLTLTLHRRTPPCPYCGVRVEPHVAAGHFDDHDGPTRLMPRRGRLYAFRCPRCSADTVTDDQGETWTLDETDYSDEGSYDRG